MRPTYFLSDIHLTGPADPQMERVCAFLRARRGEAETVYLVGDVFDLWLGYRTVVYSAFFPFLRALADLVDSGTRVVLFSGNHDPDPGSFFGEHLGIEVRERGLALELGGRRVWVEHGDTIDPRGWWRRAACQVARVPALRWVARQIHPDRAWALAQAYGRSLGAVKDYSGLPPELLDGYFRRRAAEGHDVVIIGHYHRAFAQTEVVGGRPRDFFVLGDWLKHHTFLRYDGEFVLLRDHGAGRAPEALGHGDHRPPASARTG